MHTRNLLLIAPLLLLSACGSGPNKWDATPHPLSKPQDIKIYTKTPDKYERLGTVTHLGLLDKDWDKRDPAPVFDDLLKEAASMGANGLLLVDDTTMADKSVKVTYQGMPYTLETEGDTNTVIAQAIFVTKE